jgi:hypothetical protein
VTVTPATVTPATVLGELLAAEHAAVYAYGVLGAHLDPATRNAAQAAYDAHRQSRNALRSLLVARGLPTPGPAAAYDVGARDRSTAVGLAVTLETGLQVLWRDLVATTDPTAGDLPLRRLAVRGLGDCAVRATRWRVAAAATPTTVAFPGQA